MSKYPPARVGVQDEGKKKRRAQAINQSSEAVLTCSPKRLHSRTAVKEKSVTIRDKVPSIRMQDGITGQEGARQDVSNFQCE